MLGFDPGIRPYCKAANDIILERVKKIKPDYVVLVARWNREFYNIEKLENTAKALHKLKVPHVVVIGQVPFWQQFVPHLLMSYWKMDPLHRLPPPYTRYHLDPESERMDRKIHQLSNKVGLDYLSSYDVLCKADGCLNRLGDNADELAYYDDQHMTPVGAQYLVKQFADYFLANKKD
jgi:hypothetical protein